MEYYEETNYLVVFQTVLMCITTNLTIIFCVLVQGRHTQNLDDTIIQQILLLYTLYYITLQYDSTIELYC